MNLKVLFVVFIFLLSASIICNTRIPAVNAAEGWSSEQSVLKSSDYSINNGTEPDGGDPVGGGWPN